MKEEKQYHHPCRQEPDEKARVDFKNLNETRLQKMFEATECGEGEIIKMSFNIPVEYITLAAWLSLRREQYQGSFWTDNKIDLSEVVEDPPNNHDLRCAGEWISEIIDKTMMFDAYHDLCTGYHQYLFKRPAQESEPDSEADLPF